MKRIFTLFIALLAWGTVANAQNPSVTIDVTDSTATTITASFTPNQYCTQYYILASQEEIMNQYAAMMQCSINDLVVAWSIPCTEDTVYTWTEMTPGTEYMIYVVAQGAGASEQLITRTASTASQGGEGESVITITVMEVTSTSARVICEPNDQTAVFYDQLMTVDYFNAIGLDSAIQIVKDGYYPMYATDDWTWSGLEAGTAYYALAIGKNSADEWGQVAMEQFTTEPLKVSSFEAADFSIYPNPATDMITVSGADNAREVQVLNLLGQVVYSAPVNGSEFTVNISNLPANGYILRLTSDNGISSKPFIVR